MSGFTFEEEYLLTRKRLSLSDQFAYHLPDTWKSMMDAGHIVCIGDHLKFFIRGVGDHVDNKIGEQTLIFLRGTDYHLWSILLGTEASEPKPWSAWVDKNKVWCDESKMLEWSPFKSTIEATNRFALMTESPIVFTSRHNLSVKFTIYVSGLTTRQDVVDNYCVYNSSTINKISYTADRLFIDENTYRSMKVDSK